MHSESHPKWFLLAWAQRSPVPSPSSPKKQLPEVSRLIISWATQTDQLRVEVKRKLQRRFQNWLQTTKLHNWAKTKRNTVRHRVTFEQARPPDPPPITIRSKSYFSFSPLSSCCRLPSLWAWEKQQHHCLFLWYLHDSIIPWVSSLTLQCPMYSRIHTQGHFLKLNLALFRKSLTRVASIILFLFWKSENVLASTN